jgi:serine/threonine protein kinase
VSDIAFQREFSPANSPANYRLMGLVGQGQFAQVYCAIHRRTGQLAAIKQTRHVPEQASQEPFVLHELNHPNVTNCQAIFQTQGGYQFVLDYCEAGTLRSHLTPPQPLSLSTTQALIGDILRGLGHIHQRQIIHGDLKPENILLTYSHPAHRLTAKIGDFGSARFVELPSHSRREIGSPTYAAPERFDGQSSYASDLYSVGVMLYELLIGDRPFSGSPDALRRAHQSQPVAFPARLTQAAQQLLTTALHKQPNQRFATAEAMLSALQQLSAVTAAAHPPADNLPIRPLAPSISVTPKPIDLAGIPDPIENLISLPQGCCLVTAKSLHLLTPQKELIDLARFSQACWVALSPDGGWYAAFSKSAARQSQGEFGRLWRAARAKTLVLNGPLLTSLRSDIVQLLAIDSRHVLRVRTAVDQLDKTYFECFTRRGQFLAQITLQLSITQVALTAVPYQLIAISKCTNSASKVVLITLKPFQIQTLQLPICPEKVCGLAWGYLITAGSNALLLDRLANPIGSLAGLPPAAAITSLSDHSKILLARSITHLKPSTASPIDRPLDRPLDRAGASSLFEVDLDMPDLELIF